ncbi:MAG: ATP-dependent DNA helicase RecG [Thermomicrobiales bacterium]
MADEARPQALKDIAAGFEALRPYLGTAVAPVIPKGTLPPVMRPAPAAAPAKRPSPVTPLKPSDPVTKLPKVGPAVAKKLAAHRAGISTIGHLLELAPSRHIDYSRTEPIGAALRSRPGSEVTVKGRLAEVREVKASGPPRVVARLDDGTGWMRITWFNSFIAKQLRGGDEIVVSGKIEADFGPLSFTNPEWELATGGGLSTGRLTPVYPLTKGLHQKSLRNLTRAALDATLQSISDPLPESVRAGFGLIGLAEAYDQVHYPESVPRLELAKRRLAFDDLFLLQLGHIRRRRNRKAARGIPLAADALLLRAFFRELPFQLTGAQRRALGEIMADLTKPEPMSRLLQGDVGSGKTVVAAAASLIATSHHYQVAVMAPTETLAEQHFQQFRKLFAALPPDQRPEIALLTGSTRTPERRRIGQELASGEIDLLAGTHALIQSGVEFANLGLAVVDEQHRFGVRQRAELPGKSAEVHPHVLSMTATPIPRTLNLVLNGDLDVSVIAELPPGRTPVETRRYMGTERQAAYELVRAQARDGHQAFVICPLVEESEAIEAKAAVAEAARLPTDVFPSLRVALLHGRLKSRDKDAVMTAFRQHEYDILVATSVIEVGIDIPNATVMMIEGADRFGLSQLHQFRGRVGRGGARSFCLLLADDAMPEAEQRLQTMVDTSDGFVLAEKDLELRGPGDFIGTRQSGLPELSWLDGSFDSRLLDEARRAAEQVLAVDPDLRDPGHRLLRERLEAFWLRASPDIPS